MNNNIIINLTNHKKFNNMEELLFILALLLGVSFLVAQISREREIGFWSLFAVSFLLTPFIGLAVGLFSKKKNKEGEITKNNDVFDMTPNVNE